MLKSSTKHKKYLLLLREEVHIGSQTFACTNSISLIALLAFLFRKTSQYCFPNTWFSQTSSTCFTRGKSYIVFAFAKCSKLLKFRCPNLWCYNQLSSNNETWHAYVSPPSIKGKKIVFDHRNFHQQIPFGFILKVLGLSPKSKTWCNKIRLNYPLIISFIYWHWFEHSTHVSYIVHDLRALEVAQKIQGMGSL